MDLEVQIKAEPVCLEDETNTSLGNFEFVSETKRLKQETKSELTEHGPTQENTFEPSADLEEEISIEQDTVDELLPHIKQKKNVGDVAVPTEHTGQGTHAGTMRSKSILYKLNVKKHVSTSSGKKLYLRKVCNKAFRTNGILSDHKDIHSGERLFLCDECNRSFSKKEYLLTHILLHTGVKQFYCKECNSSFTQNNNLLEHMLVHSGERPFRCIECNKSYSRKRFLRTHMLLHTGVKPYLCKECNRAFYEKSKVISEGPCLYILEKNRSFAMNAISLSRGKALSEPTCSYTLV